MIVDLLANVVEANLCTGCGICEAISGRDQVRMEIDPAGFYRPQVLQANPKVWQEIKELCPGIAVRQDMNLDANRLERLWGPVQSARVGHSTDETVRWQASSGGALSAVLIYLLETGQVEHVAHVGVGESGPFLATVHKSHTRAQVLKNAGSRYVPTAPLVSLAELLREDRARVAFMGKPCDIAALRAYGKLNPEVEQRIIFHLSFFCAGVPSMLATDDLVRALGVERSQIRRFRYRGFGWPGRATAIDLSGREYSMSYEDSWGRILGPRLQFRCKICPDGIGELADLVCGDAWYTVDGHPSFEERPGRSLILARTGKGRRLLEEAESAGYLQTERFDLGELEVIQPYQKNRRQAIVPRLLALRLLGRPVPRYEGFYLIRNAWDAGLRFFLRQFGGMVRRLA